MSSAQTHPFYPFLHFGKLDDLIEPVGFLDEPAATDKWVVVAEANPSNRRLKEFDVAPTIADAEDFLFSDACSAVLESRRLHATSIGDWDLVIALSGQRRYQNDALTVQRALPTGDTGRAGYDLACASYLPRADDDVRARCASVIGALLARHHGTVLERRLDDSLDDSGRDEPKRDA